MKKIRTLYFGTILPVIVLYTPSPAQAQEASKISSVEEYKKTQTSLAKKARKLFIRNIDLSPCITNKSDLKARTLSFLPVPLYRLKVGQIDTTDLKSLADHSFIRRGRVDFVYAISDGRYFGFYSSQDNPQRGYSEVSCNASVSSYEHSWYEQELKAIVDFRPDAIFKLGETGLNFIMIKDNEVYFLGYWNGKSNQERFKVVHYREWQKNLKERYGYSWTKLINSLQ